MAFVLVLLSVVDGKFCQLDEKLSVIICLRAINVVILKLSGYFVTERSLVRFSSNNEGMEQKTKGRGSEQKTKGRGSEREVTEGGVDHQTSQQLCEWIRSLGPLKPY